MNILKTKQRRPRRILIYGTHGIGKSTFGSCAPSPVFVPTEDGLQNIEADSFPLCKDFSAAIQAVGEVATEEHAYKTVVLDSVDWLERLIWKRVCEEGGKAEIEDFGFGKGYGLALSKWEMMIEGLEACNQRGMTVILIGHAKIEKFANPETEPYDRYTPRLHKSSSAVLQEWCDEVLFANYKVYTKDKDIGFNKTETRGIGSGERILKTTERPSHMAKNRLGMPDEIPLAFSEYAKCAEKAV